MRREVQDAVRCREEQWRKVLQAAEEALNEAETEAATEMQFEAFRSQSESIQSWIKEQKKKLLSTGSHVQFEERLQVAQVSLKVRFDLKLSGCKVVFNQKIKFSIRIAFCNYANNTQTIYKF